MKNTLTACCAVALLFGAATFAAAQDRSKAAQQSKEVQQDTKTMTADRTAKTSTDTVYGRVEALDPGKSIKVTVPGKIVQTKSFDLNDKNENANVPSDVKVGDWVSVMENTDNNGHKTLTVKHSTEKQATSHNKGA
jgi:hypothetical protein